MFVSFYKFLPFYATFLLIATVDRVVSTFSKKQIKPDKKGIYRNVPSVFSNESEIRVPQKKSFVDWVIRTAAKEGVYIEDPK